MQVQIMERIFILMSIFLMQVIRSLFFNWKSTKTGSVEGEGDDLWFWNSTFTTSITWLLIISDILFR